MSNSLEVKTKSKFLIMLNRFFDIIIVFIIFLALSLSLSIWLWPKYAEINREAQASKAELENEVDALKRYKIKLKEHIDAYDNISEAEKQRIASTSPPLEHYEDIFTELEVFFKGEGWIINSISISPSPIADSGGDSLRYGTIKISIDIMGIGSYRNFKRLLALIENSLRIYDINNLNYSGKTLSLDITAYYTD